MTRRLLLSYLSLTALVLLLLELPLGVLYGRREHDALAATARRDATGLAVLAGESLERPETHDLPTLTANYRIQTGTEVAVYNQTGQPVVGLDPSEPPGTEPDVHSLVAGALAGKAQTTRRIDDGQSQLVAALPIQTEGRTLGAVVVALPAASTDHRVTRAWVALALFAGALLGLAALVGFLLARSLAAPLVNLQRTARRLGSGELDARAPTGGPAEIAALAEEINAMADRIRQLVEVQRRFVADASHQLRTPLTALRLRLENLMAAAGPDEARELEAAEAESQRLTRLVDGLLTLSRAEDYRGERQTLDTAAIAQDRRDTWAPLAEERQVSINVEVRSPSALARVVPGHLEQILDNLLSNALEASPTSSQISLVVEGRRQAGGKLMVVQVIDHGRGMTPAERQHAFDRFWQGGDRVGGTGLGLAIVAQLAQANGGSVTLDEADSGGVVVAVTLPAA